MIIAKFIIAIFVLLVGAYNVGRGHKLGDELTLLFGGLLAASGVGTLIGADTFAFYAAIAGAVVFGIHLGIEKTSRYRED